LGAIGSIVFDAYTLYRLAGIVFEGKKKSVIMMDNGSNKLLNLFCRLFKIDFINRRFGNPLNLENSLTNLK